MDINNAIEIKNVSKCFKISHEKHSSVYQHILSMLSNKNNFEILNVIDNISFSIKKGESIGIIGINGCGKSTILKIMTKIITPDTGTVKMTGTITPFLELGIGFNGELTARDNIILYGMIIGISKKTILKQIPKIIQFAELDKFLDTKLKQFSSGMKTRLAFSTAIQADPDILILDEVLAVGDLSFHNKCKKIFRDFKKNKKTIIFVSHNRNSTLELSDKVMWLHNAKIQAYGEPKEVVDKYVKFISSINNNIARNKNRL